MVSFPYHSHIFRDSYGSDMGIVWEAYHKGVPLLGVPGITLDVWESTRDIYQHIPPIYILSIEFSNFRGKPCRTHGIGTSQKKMPQYIYIYMNYIMIV